MEEYSKKLEIRWADLDPNFHVLHSKYYDFGAFCRMSFMTEHGMTPDVMVENNIGPIIFREECHFKKEIKFGDDLSINLKLSKCSSSARKWSMIHELWIAGEKLAAIITLDGAWMDTRIRKLIIPPELFKAGFDKIPKSENFNH